MSTETAVDSIAGSYPESMRAPGGRLIASILKVAALDDTVVNRAYELFEEAYEGTVYETFVSDLNAKQLIILLHDGKTKELQGFSTIAVEDVEIDGKKAKVVYSGDTVIAKAYWGQRALYKAFARALVSVKFKYPMHRVYWFLISKGYKTYLMVLSTMKICIPVHSKPDNPAMRALLDNLSRTRFGDAYNVETGVISGEGYERVRDGLSPVEPELMEMNPDIRYFVERNPGHVNGDNLATLALVRWRDPIGTFVRQSIRKLKKQTGNT